MFRKSSAIVPIAVDLISDIQMAVYNSQKCAVVSNNLGFDTLNFLIMHDEKVSNNWS